MHPAGACMLESSISSYLRARHKTASEMERNITTLEIDRRTSYIALRLKWGNRKEVSSAVHIDGKRFTRVTRKRGSQTRFIFWLGQ
ncbi:hypothetical protein P8452_16670 [Trifolium repens]|jgi:hypothetical protein|nr:hypothetical protein P8452_16670 [Trifolium repens]